MGGDPLPARRKWLRVLYWADGERHNVVVEEKNELRVPNFLRMHFLLRFCGAVFNCAVFHFHPVDIRH
jgi:hypothetical protein